MNRSNWTRTAHLILVGVVGAGLGYALGVASAINSWPPIGTYRRLTGSQPRGYYADTRDMTAIPCPDRTGGVTVLLVLGQSNAGNWSNAAPRGERAESVVQFFDGRCYAGTDRSLGSDGEGTSIWNGVGAELVRRHAAERIVLATFAISATTIERFTTGSFFRRRLQTVVEDLKAHNLSPNAVIWFQGESDAAQKTPADAYIARFDALRDDLRRLGIVAPLYVSATTMCAGSPNASMRQTQKRIQAQAGVRPGPDTDTLGLAYRWDGCHFTSEGRDRVTQLWADALSVR